MKKSSIPQPKYDLLQTVIYQADGQKAVGKISDIEIKISKSESSIKYKFEDRVDSYDQASIIRRIIL